jgi:hypothetical protein
MIFPREGKIESGRRARGNGDSIANGKIALKQTMLDNLKARI